MSDFTPKRVGETEIFSVDYAALLGIGETITSATWTNNVRVGADPSPGAMIQGVASISGSIVSQRLTGGIGWVRYSPICTAVTSTGQTIILPEPNQGTLLVVP
ncbi:hypothetical protein [Glaciimonas sp. PCH181]|uniref:phage fiber-tail adaptor protein n=1 Tax=Glaciimonas sp. PCH181 TaxID=2133943 RepID=UPI000D3598FC|nr:hypothetical protein [Glaciimonas sp. PCH181]PUA17275.1 hypothetical protein C7W93_15195 [Glaciimonas sp. PCH181]